MEKKIFYQLTSNFETDVTVDKVSTAAEIIEAQIPDYSTEELKELEYTIKPVLMTQKQYEAMPESESY